MVALQKSFKTEIAPTPAQMRKINQTIGVCRFVYNLYIAENKKEYKETKQFISGMTFSKWRITSIFHLIQKSDGLKK